MHPSDSKRPLFIGLDWGVKQHALCLLDAEDAPQSQTLEHTPEAIAKWVAQLLEQFPDRPIRVALEQSTGALINALREFPELELYPLNPKQLARYREAVHPSGAKDDPSDAELLALFLKNHPGQLRPDQPLDEETRRLDELSKLRRKLVDDRKTLWQKLKDTLNMYFPQLLEGCPGSAWEEVLLKTVCRWPSLEELKRVHPRTLRTFLKEQGMKHKQQQTDWINHFRQARPLTENAGLIEPRVLYAQSLARQLKDLNQSIAQFEAALQKALAQHPDGELFRSLPGAGAILAPRLLCAFGSDRSQYQSAQEIQSQSGIAPITRKSGQSRVVVSRYACPKYLRQTFHEFAEYARRFSAWSRAFYQMKRAGGMKHHAALRALGYKWIRILFRMWQTRTPYSESFYLEQLRRRNSPIIDFLETAENQPETP